MPQTWCLECDDHAQLGQEFCSTCGRDLRNRVQTDRASYTHLTNAGFAIWPSGVCPKCGTSPVLGLAKEVRQTSKASYVGCNPIMLVVGLIATLLSPPKELITTKMELACPHCDARWFS